MLKSSSRLLKEFAVKGHVHLSNDHIKSLANEKSLNFNDFSNAKNIFNQLNEKRKRVLFSKDNQDFLMPNSVTNIFQFNAKMQSGLDCGYHAFLNGLSILEFINNGYSNDKENISLCNSNFDTNLEEYKDQIIKNRKKELIKASIYNYFLSKLKGAVRVDQSNGNSKPLRFQKGHIKLEPSKLSWNFSKYIDPKVILMRDVLRDVVNYLTESIYLPNREHAYWGKTKKQILEAFSRKIKGLNKSKYKPIENVSEIEQCFDELEEILINISPIGLTLNGKADNSKVNYKRKFKISLEDVQKEFLIEKDYYFEGENLSGKEIENLIKQYKDTNNTKNISIFCFGDGQDNISENISYSQDFNDLLSNLKQKEKYTGIIVLHINGNQWVTFVVDKNKKDINYFIADSLNNSNTINNYKIEFLVNFLNKELKKPLKEKDEAKSEIKVEVEIESYKKDLKLENSEKTLAKREKAKFKPKKPRFNLQFLGGAIEPKLNDWLKDLKNSKGKKLLDEKFKSNLVFYGEPGNGKTTLAEGVAGELGFDFLKVSPGELGTEYTNSGPNLLRELFKNVSTNKKPVVVCLDEIDSILINKDSESHSQETKKVVGQFLIEMNNVLDTPLSKGRVIVIACTNNYKSLPDNIKHRRLKGIEIKAPDRDNRIRLLNHFASKAEFAFDQEDIEMIADKTDKWNIDDLISLVLKANLIKSNKQKEESESFALQEKSLTEQDWLEAYTNIKEDIDASKDNCIKRTLKSANETCKEYQHLINAIGTTAHVGSFINSLLDEKKED